MPKNEPRICGLVRWHARKSDSCARAINISLSPELMRRFGRVQGVFEAPMTTKQADLVVAHLEDAFTRGALEAERRRGPSTPQETLFEDAVAVTNQAVTRLFGESGVNMDPRKATGAIMAVHGGDVIVAVWGEPELLLYRFDAEGRAKIFNLLSDEAGPAKGRTGFTNVISGQMSLGDRMVCSTRSIKDIIGPGKLDQVMRLDPGGAIDRLRDELANANDAAAVAVLVTDVAETRYVEDGLHHEAHAHASTRDLEHKETVTQEILSPSLMSTVAGAARSMAGTMIGSAASAAVGLTNAAAGAVKQHREESARLAEERAKAEAEEAKKPKWLKPGDKVVGEAKLDVVGETFCYPLIDHEMPEHDIFALAEAERQKTKTTWGAKEGDEAEEDTRGREKKREDSGVSMVTPEMMREALAQADEEIAEAVPEAAPEAVADVPDMVPSVAPESAPAESLDEILPPAELDESAQSEETPALPGDESTVEPPAVASPAPSPVDWQGLGKNIGEQAVAVKDKVKAVMLPSHMKDGTAAVVNGLRRQTLTRKLAAGATLLVIVLASVMILVNREMKIRETERQNKARYLETYQQKMDSADASLIYKDTRRATELLGEAAAALDQYQPANEQETALRQQYAEKLEQKRSVFRKEIALGEPTGTVSVTGASGAAVSLAHYAVTSGAQWFVADDGQVYRQKTGESAPVSVAKFAGRPAAAFAMGGKLMIVGMQCQTMTVAADGKTAVTAAPAGLTVTDVVPYAGNLYALDASRNRIMKISPTNNGWGAPVPYIKDGTDVSKAAALAVDSNIYVLGGDGSVTKLFKGLKKAFTLGGFDPSAATASRLLQPEGSDRLYVLDAPGARVLAFSKTDGAFIAQYKADALKGATDIQVDAKAKVLTVVSGSKAMKFALPQ